MSQTLDAIVKLRAEGKELLKDISDDLKTFGHVQEDTRRKMAQFRTDTMASNRVLTGLGATFKETHQSAYLLAGAFSQVGAIARQAATMFTQYNVAVIRTQQATEAVAQAQQAYNAAVEKFGPGSKQAADALKNFEEAQRKVTEAQREMQILMVTMIAQLPGMAMHLLNLAKALNTLAVAAKGAAIAMALFGSIITAGIVGGIAVIQHTSAVMEEQGVIITGVSKEWWDLGYTVFEYGKKQKDASDLASKSLEEQIAWIVKEAATDKERAKSIDLLKKAYSEGVISAEAFTKAMLGIKGVEPADIQKFLATTEVHIKTWQEKFVASAQDAVKAFKDAFTGPMAQIGPEMAAAMQNLVNVTNQAIKTGFIGQAQAGMQAFRDCVASKMWDIPGLAEGAMNSLVSLTNNAINSGLKGEAQKNIALFVQCAQSKELSMVKQIDGYLKQLRDQYKENQRMINYYTALGQTDRAKLYEEENAKIQQVIEQLKKWLGALLKGEKLPEIKLPEIKLPETDPLAPILDAVKKLAAEVTAFPSLYLKADATQALDVISSVVTALAEIKDKTVTITATYQSVGGGGIPSFQRGGIMPYTGLALLHAGERVQPSTMTVHQPVTMYNQISSEMDLDIVQRRIETAMVSGYRRLKDIR